MSNPSDGACVALEELPRRIGGLDVSAFDEPELAAVLQTVRAAQRCLDGIVMRICMRSDVLAAKGQAAPAVETARGSGAVGARQARRESKWAEIARSVTGLADAVAAGDLSGDHVDSMARHGAKLSEEQRAAFDFGSLVDKAKDLPPENFDRLMKRAVDAVQDDHGLTDTVAKQKASKFRTWFDHNAGMGRFAGSLDPERYEMLINAVDQRSASLAAAGDVEKNRNLAAQALIELVTTAEERRNARGRLPAITVVVDRQTLLNGPHAASLRQTENGSDIAASSVARLCCDATVRQVVLDDRGVPINVGRKHRTATDGQWAAIKATYSGCAWDGCSAPINWCQAHHILEWEQGGRTDLDNLVPLCSQHHHRVHEGGWHIKLEPDRSLQIQRPCGALHCTVPGPSRQQMVGSAPEPSRTSMRC